MTNAAPANGCQPIETARNRANKARVREAMEKLVAGGHPGDAYADDALWRGSHPMNEVTGPDAIAETAWQPLRAAFPDLERRDLIVNGGTYRNRHGETREMVACMGHYCGTFKTDWLGIPATGQSTFIRYGEVHELGEDGRIIRSSCLWDVLDVIRQAGFWPLAPSWGAEGMWAGPITADGLTFNDSDMDEGLASIAQTLAMHKALADYDDHAMAGRQGLIDMPQREHWHDKMMWYGPSGIGTTRGLAGFVDFHQLPFRLTWPGRAGGQSLIERGGEADEMLRDAGHYIQIGDGPYSVTGGWPSVVALNNGPGDVFGCGATGQQVGMRVMDFYLHHEGKIRENWVPLDVIHLLLQQGVDVMARVRDQFGRNRLGLRD